MCISRLLGEVCSLLQERRKRHTGERCELIVCEVQVPARQHRACQRTCTTTAVLKRLPRVRLSSPSMGQGDSHSHLPGGSAVVKGTGTYRSNLAIRQIKVVINSCPISLGTGSCADEGPSCSHTSHARSQSLPRTRPTLYDTQDRRLYFKRITRIRTGPRTTLSYVG
jgi:hypothetical protein